MKRVMILFTLGVFILLTLMSSFAVENRLLTVDEVKEDIEFLLETMEEVHPDLYANYSKDDLDKEINIKLSSLLEYTSSKDIYKQFGPIIGKLNDGHTGLFMPNEYINELKTSQYIIPIKAYLKDSRVYMKTNFDSSDSIYKNAEILSINDCPANEIYNSMLRHVSGKSISYKEATVNSRFLDYFYIENKMCPEYKLELVDSEGTNRKITVNGVDLKKYIDFSSSKDTDSNATEYYSYEQLDDKTYCLTFNAFVDYDAFSTLLKTMFKEIEDKSIENLVIDIRNNGGGNSRLGDLLIESIYDGNFTQISRMDMKVSEQTFPILEEMINYSGLSEEEKNIQINELKSLIGQTYVYESSGGRNLLEKAVFDGNIYLLTSSSTFSSASMFAATFKDYNIGYIVGEETGGLATNFGDMYTFQLPNSKISAHVSYKYFVRPNGLDTHRGVIPDYDINNLDNKDALEIVLEIIKNLKK